MKKDVEKNLEKEKKELKALEKMKDLSVTNPKMGKPETFQGQILECQKRIQDHERRIAQVDSWLGLEPSQPSSGRKLEMFIFDYTKRFHAILSRDSLTHCIAPLPACKC